jgi:splicing factor 3A subunit 1
LFDPVTGQSVTDDELARRKKAAVQSFDGHPEGKTPAQLSHMQNVNVEEQIRAIHEKFAAGK